MLRLVDEFKRTLHLLRYECRCHIGESEGGEISLRAYQNSE